MGFIILPFNTCEFPGLSFKQQIHYITCMILYNLLKLKQLFDFTTHLYARAIALPRASLIHGHLPGKFLLRLSSISA